MKTELESALAGVKSTVEKSTIVSAAQKGTAQLGLNAIGIIAGTAVTGDPLAGGLVGLATTQTAQLVSDVFKTLLAKRDDKLLLALAASFDSPR